MKLEIYWNGHKMAKPGKGKPYVILLIVVLFIIAATTMMAEIVEKPYHFQRGTVISSEHVNANFDVLYAQLNGGLSNDNISPTANIDPTKIASGYFATMSDLSAGIPKGVIVMWSGSLDTIPNGWQLCDGTNNSPDLRDRFIMGVHTSENPGVIGGSMNPKVPPHTHNINDPGHSHTVYAAKDGTCASGSGGVADPTYRATSSDTTGIAILNTGNNVISDIINDTSWMPPYYKLAFIIKL